MSIKNIIRLLLIFSLSIFLGACNTLYLAETPDSEEWEPRFPDDGEQKNANGAIYSVTSARMLFQDKKALRTGDIITVVLSENTQATKTADTELSKDTSINTTPPTLFGNVPDIGMGTINLGLDITSANAFKAETDSAQSNLLNGTISVTVQKVYSNGNLAIRGEKWISLNQGSEFIRISGLIRPEDIDKDNQVVSTKVANARIHYGGSGPLAEANREGWLGRFFNSFWWPL